MKYFYCFYFEYLSIIFQALILNSIARRGSIKDSTVIKNLNSSIIVYVAHE